METERIKNLQNGECCIIGGGEGKAEIWLINRYYFVFEIPECGGEPMFSKFFFLCNDNTAKDAAIVEILKLINSWT